MNQKNYQKVARLIESEIEKAEIVLATRNEIVDKLQRDAEKLGNMKIDVLSPLTDRIKAEHGLEVAERFQHRVSAILDQALQAVLKAKDEISTETLKLTGDLSSDPAIADLDDGGMDVEETDVEVPAFDMEAEAGLDPLAGDEEVAVDDFEEAMPEEREMKESAAPKKVSISVVTAAGNRGIKHFQSLQEMNDWCRKNKSKIKIVESVTVGGNVHEVRPNQGRRTK